MAKKIAMSVPPVDKSTLGKELLKRGLVNIKNLIKSTTTYPMLFAMAKSTLEQESKKIKILKKLQKELPVNDENKELFERVNEIETEFQEYMMNLYKKFNEVYNDTISSDERVKRLFAVISINPELMESIEYYKDTYKNVNIDSIKIEKFDYSKINTLAAEMQKAIELEKEKEGPSLKQPGKNVNLGMPGF